MCDSRIKGVPGSEMELNPVFKEINRLTILNGINGMVTSEQVLPVVGMGSLGIWKFFVCFWLCF